MILDPRAGTRAAGSWLRNARGDGAGRGEPYGEVLEEDAPALRPRAMNPQLLFLINDLLRLQADSCVFREEEKQSGVFNVRSNRGAWFFVFRRKFKERSATYSWQEGMNQNHRGKSQVALSPCPPKEFAGRVNEKTKLLEVLQGSKDRGQVVLVSGRRGSGKSSFLNWAQYEIQNNGSGPN